LNSPIEVYEAAKTKFDNIIRSLTDLLATNSMVEAARVAEALRTYYQCSYCSAYRQTTEQRGWSGICSDCPLHAHGELLARKRIKYNGCYQVPSYREMVKMAFWFDNNRNRQSLQKLISLIEGTVDYMDRFRDNLIIPKRITL